MRLADQWRETERGLGDGWGDARLSLTVSDEAKVDRAAALLGPLAPGRRRGQLRFSVARRGGGSSAGAVRRALQRLDEEGIQGKLELLGSGETVEIAPAPRETLAASWDEQVAGLPADWSDLYAEIELTSTDHLDRGALLLAPVNPARVGPTPTFRFRVARRFGYGASPGMVRRCLERLGEEGLRGDVRVLRALSDTQPVATQGPVWYVGGKAV